MTAEATDATFRFDELGQDVLAVTLRPVLNEVPWTDIERTGSGIVSRIEGRTRPQVLVDLTELNQMGSAIVALVVRVWKTVSGREGRMVVVNRNVVVGEVLEIAGLAGRWTIVSDRQAALKAFGTRDNKAGRWFSAGASPGSTLTVAAAVLAALSWLGLADAAFEGIAARSLGRNVFVGISVAFAAAALVASLIATAATAGRSRIITACLAAASLAAVVIGIVLLANSPDAGAETELSGRTPALVSLTTSFHRSCLEAGRSVQRFGPV